MNFRGKSPGFTQKNSKRAAFGHILVSDLPPARDRAPTGQPGPTGAAAAPPRGNHLGAREQKLSTSNLWIAIFVLAPGRPRLAIFIFFVSQKTALQKSTVLKMDFFEGGRPKIPLKRRATDTSGTWGVEKRLKFKKAPFSTHPTFRDFPPTIWVGDPVPGGWRLLRHFPPRNLKG